MAGIFMCEKTKKNKNKNKIFKEHIIQFRGTKF